MGKFRVSMIATLRGDVEMEVPASTVEEAARMIKENQALFYAQMIEELEFTGDIEVDVSRVEEASQP